MRIGIVGSEGAKFTPETEEKARELIRQHINEGDTVVSGACHLGGIDIWAIEEARKKKLSTVEHPPSKRQWEGGYKQRNLLIAKDSDLVICITVKQLPETYTGMKFPMCYHCGTKDHVKSGGCWTVKQAKRMGKEGYVLVVE